MIIRRRKSTPGAGQISFVICVEIYLKIVVYIIFWEETLKRYMGNNDGMVEPAVAR